MRYRLQWYRGPSAVIDVQQQGDTFFLRYDGPFRLTLRRGLEELQITPDDLDGPVGALRRIAGSTGMAAARGGGPALDAEEVLEGLIEGGDSLRQILLPRFVAADLASGSVFLEVGTDEHLLHVPFELMRDETDFVSLHHALGRYVNLAGPMDVSGRLDTEGDLRVLLICVPKPQPTAAGAYERLAEADAEFTAVSTLLTERGIDFVPMYSDQATRAEVGNALKGKEKHTIIHFTGHGHVDESDPRKSGLVLFDGILTTGVVGAYLRHAPALAFINGCETARTVDSPGGVGGGAAAGAGAGGGGGGGGGDGPAMPVAHLTRVFGISRPFLQQGSYVLGTRWRVSDKASAAFATSFYASLLDGAPVGQAVMDARRAVYDPGSTDLSWASYVYYGDPRVGFLLEQPPQAAPGADAPLPVPEPGVPRDAAMQFVEQYRSIRDEPPSAEGTLRLEELIRQVRPLSGRVDPADLVAALGADDEGERMLGVALARGARQPEVWGESLLAVVREPKSELEEYHALETLLEAVESFTDPQRVAVRDLLLGKLGEDQYLNSDRAIVARLVLAKVPEHPPRGPAAGG
ncbi:MAG: CHAT domain-containing protein [Actinomycetales bacterium]|nr:CHAT domain-containing protein [Actinomycetales bacterium]